MSIRRSLLPAAVLSVLSVSPNAAQGHDSWLVADRHRINEGERVWLAFVTGEVFPYGDAATDPARVAGFVRRVGSSSVDITGLSPEDHVLSVRGPIQEAGLHVIGCRLRPRLIELEADLFDRYLRDERAEEAIALREAARQAGPVVERYTKFAKTLIEVHPVDPADEGYRVPLGHRLEIVPLSNPCRWQAGSTVEVEVLLDGHPWPNVPISVGHEGLDRHEYVARTRTDSRGVAEIRLKRPGHGFIKAHLIRPGDGVAAYAWESFWASLTFDVQGKASTSGAIQAIRAVHGELTPWAVAGYRAGRRALRELGLPRGSRELLAVYRTPLESPFAGFADGVQAATGATIGKLNLRLVETDVADIRCDFTDRSSGRTVRYEVDEALLNGMLGKAAEEAEAFALKILTLAEGDVIVAAPPAHSHPAISEPWAPATDSRPILVSRPALDHSLGRSASEHR